MLAKSYNQTMDVGVHEAKTTLSALLRRVSAGEDVVITRSGKPVAKIVAIHPRRARTLGIDVGRMQIPDDFNAPLDEATLAAFEA